MPTERDQDRMTMPARRRVCRILGILLLATLALPAAAAECVLAVRTHDDPPYSMAAPDGAPGGISIELVREGLRRIGCSASFEDMPFARALGNLQAGQVAVPPRGFQ